MTKIGDKKKPPRIFTYEERCQQWLDKKPRDTKSTKNWFKYQNLAVNRDDKLPS